MADGSDRPELGTLDPVVKEAAERFQQVSEWESIARSRMLEDIKFRNGDSDNGYQWPNAIRASRNGDSKPCLTLNVIRQHNLQISNQARENKSSVRFVGTGNNATADGAEVLKQIMRRIEYESNAQDKYTNARGFQIDGGIGWWRLYTDYAGPDTFDQEIFIGLVPDPFMIYFDPNSREKDGSDGNWAFVFDTMPEEEFFAQYPKYKSKRLERTSPLGIGIGASSWIPKGHTVVAEYFRRVPKTETLVSFVVKGVRQTIRESLLAPNMRVILDDPLTKTREVTRMEVEWYLIVGDKVVDQTVWIGSYIPLIRCVGEMVTIDGVMEWKGHTRWMKDAQQMYNFNASAQVEHVALQGKTPWTGPIAAIEEFETIWNTANTSNYSFLPYKHVDEQGNVIPAPTRVEPAKASPAFQAGMETAFNQMMMTSGQWQNQMGMMGNERTGAAIGKRQAQGDTATFHFEDNYASALMNTGKQILEIIPKVYDTKRIFKILAEDETDQEIEIDPAAKKAYEERLLADGKTVKKIFNPNIGTYGVAPSVGPAYGTRREETRDALTLILTQNKELVPVVGDLLMGSMDFDKAREAAARLHRLVPPQALGEGPTQNEQKLMGQIQSLTISLAKSLETGAKSQTQLAGKAQMRDIDTYKAETDRLGVMIDSLPLDQAGLTQLVQQLVQEALGTSLAPITAANANNLDQDGALPPEAQLPPMPEGAAPAVDGEHYMPHPDIPGQFLHVARVGPGGAHPPARLGAKLAPDGHHYVPNPYVKGKFLRVTEKGAGEAGV